MDVLPTLSDREDSGGCKWIRTTDTAGMNRML